MEQACQDDMRTVPSRSGETGITTRMVEKGIQQQQLAGRLCICESLLEIVHLGKPFFWFLHLLRSLFSPI